MLEKSGNTLRTVIFGIVVLTLVPSGIASADTFADRAETILTYAAGLAYEKDKLAPMLASARFTVGDDDGARAFLTRAFNAYPSWRHGAAGMYGHTPVFLFYSHMACYMRWHDKYTPALKAALEQRISTFDTRQSGYYITNWMAMHAAAFALAKQAPGIKAEISVPVCGVSWAPECGVDFPTAEDWLRWAAEQITHVGLHEYNSHMYSPLIMDALMSIAEYHNDPELVNQMRLAIEHMLIRHASTFMRGHMLASTLRTYGPNLRQNNNGMPTHALYFGGPLEDNLYLSAIQLVELALSSYRPPDYIVDLAWDPKANFIHREAHFTGVQADGASKSLLQAWTNETYGMYSNYQVKNQYYVSGSTYHPGQHKWAVLWDKDHHPPSSPPEVWSTFYVKHPDPTLDGGKREKSHNGADKADQTLHKENVLINVYNIPQDHINPYVHGATSADHDAIINEVTTGSLYLHYGSVMIAIRALDAQGGVGFTLTDIKLPWYTIKIDQRVLATIVETALPQDYPGATPMKQLSTFKAAAEAKFNNASFSTPSGRPKLVYTTVAGDVLHLEWRNRPESSVRLINGIAIPDIDDPANWPLVGNEWVSQPYDSDTLVFSRNGTKKIYDFKNWTVTHLLPGNVDMSGSVGLKDGIVALQIASGMIPASRITNAADTDNDDRVGIAEAIYILRELVQCIASVCTGRE